MKNFKLKNSKRLGLSERSESKGFTIIELVISISILSVAVVGIFNALSVLIILTSDSADRLTGTYLAQEGMEIVRNIRDTNWLDMNKATLAGNVGTVYSWDNGLASNGFPDHPNCESQSNKSCRAD